jgi:hypothetical protein
MVDKLAGRRPIQVNPEGFTTDPTSHGRDPPRLYGRAGPGR